MKGKKDIRKIQERREGLRTVKGRKIEELKMRERARERARERETS